MASLVSSGQEWNWTSKWRSDAKSSLKRSQVYARGKRNRARVGTPPTWRLKRPHWETTAKAPWRQLPHHYHLLSKQRYFPLQVQLAGAWSHDQQSCTSQGSGLESGVRVSETVDNFVNLKVRALTRTTGDRGQRAEGRSASWILI